MNDNLMMTVQLTVHWQFSFETTNISDIVTVLSNRFQDHRISNIIYNLCIQNVFFAIQLLTGSYRKLWYSILHEEKVNNIHNFVTLHLHVSIFIISRNTLYIHKKK